MNEKQILYIFTRTPLHVGAGASVGAIDQPIIRERHTGFPVIPASSLKGTFADAWNDGLHEQDGKKHLRLTTKKNEKDDFAPDKVSDAAWLFGSNNDKVAFSGALQFSEARLLAFPIRSARGSFAWITSPVLLRRAHRDGVVEVDLLKGLKEPADDKAIFDSGKESKLALGEKIVLEEYTFEAAGWLGLDKLSQHLVRLIPSDSVWAEVASRLVILSDGMMSFFAQNACEIAQHVTINDETGTAAKGLLFNQENVPSETLFYSVIHAFKERVPNETVRSAEQALNALGDKLKAQPVFQFGGDASTGLGYCTVVLK